MQKSNILYAAILKKIDNIKINLNILILIQYDSKCSYHKPI